MKSGTELSQFIRIFLPSLLVNHLHVSGEMQLNIYQS